MPFCFSSLYFSKLCLHIALRLRSDDDDTDISFQASGALNKLAWTVFQCSLLDKLETTPLRVVVSYAYLVFSQPPTCLHQAM